MASHNYRGGHEIEAVNTDRLFKIMIPIGLATFLASLAVYDFYQDQRARISESRAVKPGVTVAIYQSEMEESLKDLPKFRETIKDPQVLAPSEAPQGWVHPDDIGKAPVAQDAAATATETPAP